MGFTEFPQRNTPSNRTVTTADSVQRQQRRIPRFAAQHFRNGTGRYDFAEEPERNERAPFVLGQKTTRPFHTRGHGRMALYRRDITGGKFRELAAGTLQSFRYRQKRML